MKAFIHLENGETMEGKIDTTLCEEVEGELVFFTGMTGYQEVLTDPSYNNQIIVFTYPQIGNYGINEVDFESKKPHVKAVVVHEYNEEGFHFQAKSSLLEYLNKWNIPILFDVDTRALVKRIREQGTMMSKISTYKDVSVQQMDSSVHMMLEDVSIKEPTIYGEGEEHIVLMDFGFKQSILTSLLSYHVKVTVVPYDFTFEQVSQLKPDGILLSNGPGDPKQVTNYLSEIKKIVTNYPTLGICLGHQIIALAFDGDTEKLRFGHRGANQPVMDKKTKKVFMTSQNHSFVVNGESLKSTELHARFYNVNDESIEGLEHNSLPILSVQYHPEANPGPSEGNWIFDEFLGSISANRRVKAYA